MTFLPVFLIGLGLILVAVLAMAVGVMLGRKPISGSCGGIANGSGSNCSMCSRRESCQESAKESAEHHHEHHDHEHCGANANDCGASTATRIVE